MVQVLLLYSLTLIFIFKIKVLAFFLFCEYTQKVRHRANITIAIRYEVVYLPSNVVHHDPDLLFQGYDCLKYDYLDISADLANGYR